MAPAITRDDFRFLHPLRVRFSEVDAQGVVFNANYFVYFDTALVEHLRDCGVTFGTSFQAWGVETHVVDAQAQFHAPARFDDELYIGARVTRLGRTSFTHSFGVFRGEEHLVTGRIVNVCVDLKTKRPAPLPDEFVAVVEHGDGVEN